MKMNAWRSNLLAASFAAVLIFLLISGAVFAFEEHREGEMKKFCNDKGGCTTLVWDGIGWIEPEKLNNPRWKSLRSSIERYKRSPGDLTMDELEGLAYAHDYRCWDANGSHIYVPENAYVEERLYKESIKKDPMRSWGYSDLAILCDDYLYKFKPSCYDEVYNLCLERVKKYPFYIRAYSDLELIACEVKSVPFNPERCKLAVHYMDMAINRTKDQINTCDYGEMLADRMSAVVGWLRDYERGEEVVKDYENWVEKYYVTACRHPSNLGETNETLEREKNMTLVWVKGIEYKVKQAKAALGTPPPPQDTAKNLPIKALAIAASIIAVVVFWRLRS